MTDTRSDHQLAAQLATDAGRLLVEVRADLQARGASPWQVKDAGDIVSHEYLAQAIAQARPGDAVLSEEGAEDRRRFDAERVWIIDPLDGTNEFGEPGRHDWAVHIALWERGALTAGAVSLPALEMTFATDPAPELADSSRQRPRLITSRTRAPYAAVVVAEQLGCDAVRLGSAGAKTMAIIVGEADIYVHDGGMYQWDSAAPAAVARAAGLHVSRIDGSELVYNDRDPWLPDLLVCRPEYATPVLDALWGTERRGAGPGS
ncbi:MAG: 3'(2'),5'-bisphosphate nucleotidase CysQ [Actinomycetota bacterium]|nr:MAG: 3'(2'),5'-bisphosphate nucleotidase CysQ [Actinomycetota bacterium]